MLLFTLIIQLNLSAATSDEHIAEVNRLRDQGLYKSAWIYLHEHAEQIDFSRMMISKTELCIRYYAITNLHQMFSFVDLAAGETLNDVRKTRNSMEDMKLFDPAGGLLTALEKDPENGELHYWLGEFYFDQLYLFGSENGLSEEDLQYQIVKHYRAALDKGWKDEILLANLAYTELTIKEWSSSILHFRKALEINPDNPAYHHNLAMALMNDNQLVAADGEIRKTLKLYKDDSYKADSLFLGSTIALMEDNSQETLAYLLEGKKTAPEDYRFPERLIQVNLVMNDREAALENSRVFFELYPASPESCQTIMNHFNAFDALEELLPFFEKLMPPYEKNPEVLGNLQYHLGVSYLMTDRKDLALEQLNKAANTFATVFSKDHQIFSIIENLKLKIETQS